MTPRRLFFVFNILAILSLLLQGGNIQIGQASSPVLMSGIFTTVWGDGIQESGESRITYFLYSTKYGNIQLIIDESLLTSKGGSVCSQPKNRHCSRAVAGGREILAGPGVDFGSGRDGKPGWNLWFTALGLDPM